MTKTEQTEFPCNHCRHPAHCGQSCIDDACDHCSECACIHCQAQTQESRDE